VLHFERLAYTQSYLKSMVQLEVIFSYPSPKFNFGEFKHDFMQCLFPMHFNKPCPRVGNTSLGLLSNQANYILAVGNQPPGDL
jgi:hypothetical protein